MVAQARRGIGVVGVDPIPREVLDQHRRQTYAGRNLEPERRDIGDHNRATEPGQSLAESVDHPRIMEWGVVKTFDRRLEVLDQRRILHQADVTREAVVCEASG
jgi:hypothetical protein